MAISMIGSVSPRNSWVSKMQTILILMTLITFLLVIIEHYFPWQALIRKPLPQLMAYVLGVLSIAIPFTALILLVPEIGGSQILISFWIIVAAAALGICLAHGLDAYLRARSRADETGEREGAMIKRLKK